MKKEKEQKSEHKSRHVNPFNYEGMEMQHGTKYRYR